MAAAPTSTRAVLADGVTRDDVDDAFGRLGYRLVNVMNLAAGRPAQIVFARAADDYVHVVDDQQLELSYIAMVGTNAQDALAELSRELPLEEARAAREGMDAGDLVVRARGLAALVLLEPDAPDLGGYVEAALRDADPRLRRVGLTAAAYAPRASLRDTVLALRDGDPELALRDVVARVLAAAFSGEAP